MEDRFRLWATHPYFDEQTRFEVAELADLPEELEERFRGDLTFGTGGLRALIGAGPARMNRYTVRHVTRGLAAYIAGFGAAASRRGVVIAHDPRHGSAEFAREAALTLAAAGVRAYLWDSLRPTPLLSFAVRELGAMAGVVITASHNPPAYNGYKVYWEDGGQVPPQRADEILKEIQAVELTAVPILDEDSARAAGLLQPVPPAVDRAYLDRLLDLIPPLTPGRAECRILYTPLHGSGCVPVTQVLREAGFSVSLVEAQAEPDPQFSTVGSPNPEEPAVYRMALEQAAVERPELILATDPDADRLGALVRTEAGEYRHLTGNQIGALLTDYLLAERAAAGTLPADGAVLKSIASSNFVAPICRQYGVTLIETHTGFKFIADLIREFEETGRHTFLFGFEESYGYLAGSFVRDKDAVMAALLLAEAAAFNRQRGRTLLQALEHLFDTHGHFREALVSATLPGREGRSRMAALMADLRAAPPGAFGPARVRSVVDYAAGAAELPPADVLQYRLDGDGFVMVRPSGTEPKLKLYVSVSAPTGAAADALLEEVRRAALRRLRLDGNG